MAQRITAFQAADGTLFTSAAECAGYEKNSLLAVGVAAALGALGLTGARVVTEDGYDDLQNFLITNSELLVESLSIAPVKTERKPRQPKPAVEVKPVVTEEKPKDIAPIVIKADDTPAPEVKVQEPDASAGQAAEDELAALLGGDEVSL